MSLVRKKEAPTNQIDDFIAFVDHDHIMEVGRPMVPEFRGHPSESDHATSSLFEFVCRNSQNPGMIRILQSLVHRLPPKPGAECPMTEGQKAFREKYKPEFDAMRAGQEEMMEGFKEFQRAADAEIAAAAAPVANPGKCSVSSCENDPATLRCARYKFVYYWGKDCQKSDWNTHKRTCRPPESLPPLPSNIVLRVGPVTTFGAIMEQMRNAGQS